VRIRPHIRPVRVGVLLASFAAAASLILGLGGPPGPRKPACSQPIPSGSSKLAAEHVVDLFVRTTLVGEKPACRAQLVSPALGRELAASRLAIYPSRYPGEVGGSYQLAPRVRNPAGLWEYAGFLLLQSPDGPPAAFEFLLELHGDRWLMWSVVLVDNTAAYRFPT
jgi:hypothetical protein